LTIVKGGVGTSVVVVLLSAEESGLADSSPHEIRVTVAIANNSETLNEGSFLISEWQVGNCIVIRIG